jgi:Fur family ferric uptake transcriptional regulator
VAQIHSGKIGTRLMKEHAVDMDKYSALLKTKGLKVTSPRVTVLDIFNQSDSRHLSAEDVYKKVLEHEGDIGLATVYRVLTQFADAGILVATNFETGKTTFELNEGGHHDHLVCLNCGSVVEFHDEEVELRQEKIAKKHGFKLINHSMSLYGLCSKPECAESTH